VNTAGLGGDGVSIRASRRLTKTATGLSRGGEPGDLPAQFSSPHGIAVHAEDHVYVADRGNRQIQVFDGEGKFVRQIMIDMPFDSNASPAIGNKPILPIKGPQTMAPGSPWAICITPVLVEARGLSSRNRTGVALDTIAADHGPDSLGSLRAGVWACAEGNTLSRHSLRTP